MTRRESDAVLLPDEALRHDNGTSTAMVVTGSKARRREVRVGWSVGGQTQVVGGLEPGEEVVIGSPALRDGAEVKVVPGDRKRGGT